MKALALAMLAVMADAPASCLLEGVTPLQGAVGGAALALVWTLVDWR